MKTVITIAMMMTLVSCFEQKSEKKVNVSQYENIATEIIKNIKELSFEDLSVKTTALIEASKSLASSISEIYPKCKAHLANAVSEIEKMKTLSVEQIEEDYHDAQEAEDGICAIAGEAIYHPVEAFAATKLKTQKAREIIKEEIEEVIEHLEIFKGE